MTQTTPETGVESDDPSLRTTDDSPALVLRNEDDTPHALDLRIADADAVLTEDRHTVAGGDSQYAVSVAETNSRTLSIDLRADHGGSASLTVDRHGSSFPEFVVRRNTIVVAGLD